MWHRTQNVSKIGSLQLTEAELLFYIFVCGSWKTKLYLFDIHFLLFYSSKTFKEYSLTSILYFIVRAWAQLSAPLTEPPWLRWVDSGHWSFSHLLSESLSSWSPFSIFHCLLFEAAEFLQLEAAAPRMDNWELDLLPASVLQWVEDQSETSNQVQRPVGTRDQYYLDFSHSSGPSMDRSFMLCSIRSSMPRRDAAGL